MPERVDLPVIAECRLDTDGLRRQRDRYRALGEHVTASDRRPGSLAVRFGAEVDVALLRETIETERSCCPFLTIAARADGRELVIGVSRPEQDPALDALADAFAGRT